MNIKSYAGKPYRPSNGIEGMIFEDHFCSQCIHQNPDPEKEKNCEIAMRAFCFDMGEKDYPSEWKYDPLGNPTCTAFVNWNWGEDGDPDDPDNPKAPPPPPDPMQLNLFPLYPTELTLVPEHVTIQNRPGNCNNKVSVEAEAKKD